MALTTSKAASKPTTEMVNASHRWSTIDPMT